MNPAGCEGELLRRLAWTPFLDRVEMARLSGWSGSAVYQAVQSLERGGLVDSVSPRGGPHAPGPPLLPHRPWAAAAGQGREHDR